MSKRHQQNRGGSQQANQDAQDWHIPGCGKQRHRQCRRHQHLTTPTHVPECEPPIDPFLCRMYQGVNASGVGR